MWELHVGLTCCLLVVGCWLLVVGCWSELEPALKAATHGSEQESLHGKRQHNPAAAGHCPTGHTPPTRTASDAPAIDTKGSIRYWKQRKKYMTDKASSIKTDCARKLE